MRRFSGFIFIFLAKRNNMRYSAEEKEIFM